MIQMLQKTAFPGLCFLLVLCSAVPARMLESSVTDEIQTVKSESIRYIHLSGSNDLSGNDHLVGNGHSPWNDSSKGNDNSRVVDSVSITDLYHLAENFAETLYLDDFEDEEALQEYLEGLLDIFPLDLNRSTQEELLLVPGMSDHIADAIVRHRSGHPFQSVDDLLEVKGIGRATFSRLRPWVFVQQQNRQRRWTDDIAVQQFFRYQHSYPVAHGYFGTDSLPPGYPGSPARLYHRQTVTSSRLSINLTQVKLPGEPFRTPEGFDFSSFHFSISGSGTVRRLIIGDYALRFGQGLVVWSNASFGKGGVTHTAPYRRAQGVTPYRSSGQIRFFRGLATEILLPVPVMLRSTGADLTLTTFYSRRSRSAVELFGDTIRPPVTSSYHRTETERSRRNNTLETVRGGNITLRHQQWSLGFTSFSHELDRPVVPHPNSPPLRGSRHHSAGLDFTMDLGAIRMFGEYAMRTRGSPAQPNHMPIDPTMEPDDSEIFEYAGSETDPAANFENGRVDGFGTINGKSSAQTKRSAWIAGIMGSHYEGTEWVFAIRSYQPGYWSEYASGFGEGSGVPANQSGWYFGFRLRPVARITLSGFLDRFIFFEPRRGLARPISGWEPMLHLLVRHRPGLNFQIRIRYKERSMEEKQKDEYMRTYLVSGATDRLTGRFQLNWQVHKRFFIRSQYDAIRTSGSHSADKYGIAISNTARWQLFRTLRLDLGWALFDTDDYSSRLYLYEHDLTFVMTSRMVYGVGRQSYAVVRYRPVSWLLAEVKYSRVRYADRPVVGTGRDLTTGPVRSHIGFQLRFQY